MVSRCVSQENVRTAVRGPVASGNMIAERPQLFRLPPLYVTEQSWMLAVKLAEGLEGAEVFRLMGAWVA